MTFIYKLIAFPFLVLIRIYQWVISPLLPQSCRFTPTCSVYMAEAIKVWGPFKGIYLGVKRMSKCHPWGGHGHDPVPPKDESNG